MVAAVDSMAYANEPPWHGLGNAVSNKLTPEQMLKAAGLDWKVELREMSYAAANGKDRLIVPGKKALVRADNDKILSVVGSVYKPVQNEAVLDFFKKFVVAGHMKMETAGSLHSGQYIWALARLGSDFKLGKDDAVHGYLLLCNPHVFGKAMMLQSTSIRVVCWNTLTWALGSDLRGRGDRFAMPHSVEFTDAVRAKAEVALGFAKNQMDQFKEMATLLSKKKAPAAEVEEYFCEVLRFDPKKAEKKKEDSVDVLEPRMLPKLRKALLTAPGATLRTAEGTWWGALNAVTQVIDHGVGRDQDASLRTAWFGVKAGIKRNAAELAVKRAS